jgi:hypothetical protein
VSDFEAALAVWKERLAAVTRNANELAEAEFTKRIRNRFRDGVYAGKTAECARQAVEQLSTLMDDYLLLGNVIEEAEKAARAGFLRSSESREAQVAALLDGPSIRRPLRRVALQQRDLLGAAQDAESMTPQQLLTCMQREFREARDVLAEIDFAETRAAQDADALTQDYALLEKRAAELQSTSDRPSFIHLTSAQSDPLGTFSGVESIKRSLQAWAEKLSELEAERSRARAGVEQGRVGLTALYRQVGEHAALAENVRELFGPAVAGSLKPVGMPAFATLKSWCEALENSLHAGDWHAVNVGASRFALALANAQSDEQAGIAEARARVTDFEDLAGRFRALKAKAHMLRERGAALGDAAVLAVQLELLLEARPIDTDQLRVTLKRYQDLLSAASV